MCIEVSPLDRPWLIRFRKKSYVNMVTRVNCFFERFIYSSVVRFERIISSGWQLSVAASSKFKINISVFITFMNCSVLFWKGPACIFRVVNEIIIFFRWIMPDRARSWVSIKIPLIKQNLSCHTWNFIKDMTPFPVYLSFFW